MGAQQFGARGTGVKAVAATAGAAYHGRTTPMNQTSTAS